MKLVWSIGSRCVWAARAQIAINAAPVEFLRDDFAEILLEKLQRFAVEPVLIELEITEQVLTDSGSAFVAPALSLLKDVGMRIALDDFGTGRYSLAQLIGAPARLHD